MEVGGGFGVEGAGRVFFVNPSRRAIPDQMDCLKSRREAVGQQHNDHTYYVD